MSYIDGFVLAVPEANRDAYEKIATRSAEHFKKHGAVRVVETWESEVPDGKQTSFPMAVKREPGEAVVFSWIEWPSRAARDAAMQPVMDAMQNDPEMQKMPFDGMRMIFGSFDVLLDA